MDTELKIEVKVKLSKTDTKMSKVLSLFFIQNLDTRKMLSKPLKNDASCFVNQNGKQPYKIIRVKKGNHGKLQRGD